MSTIQTRTVPSKESISFPVLMFTDALPRDDLQSINNGKLDGREIVTYEFPRPRTSTQPATSVSTFDFGLTASPKEAAPSGEKSDRSPLLPPGIGIALGSPGMLKSQKSPPPARFYTSISTEPPKERGTPTRKSSKWKKLGGLFKAKNAFASTHDSQSEKRKESPTKNRADSDDHTSIRRIRRDDTPTDWRLVDVDRNASTNKIGSPRRVRNFSMSTLNVSNEHSATEHPHPHLDVEIPDIQLDRYSVMFSNVMNKIQQPSLLARRSKTLDNLRVPSAEPFLAPKGNPVPRRRATSPAHTNFTLFPTSHPPKAAKVLGTQSYTPTPVHVTRTKTSSTRNSSENYLKAPRAFSNRDTDSTASFDSQILPNLFAEHSNTPSLLNSRSRQPAKPFPTVKTEQPFQSKTKRVSPQAIQAAQNIYQEEGTIRQMDAFNGPSPAKQNRNHLNLTINTEATQLPPAAAKRDIVMPSNPTCGEESPSNQSEEQEELIASPSPILADPKHTTASPEPTHFSPMEELHALPTIEVSVARSISVKTGKRQVLVPIGARVDHLSSNERLVDKKALTPRVMDVRCGHGHRHVVSQELQIESL